MRPNNENTHILIHKTIFNGVPDCFEKFELINSEELNIEYKESEMKPQAILEWFKPSEIAIFVYKAYFETYIQEISKDHLAKLKSWITLSYKKTRPFIDKVVVNSVSPDSPKNNFFCLYFQVPSGSYLKIFFPHSNNSDRDIKLTMNLLEDLNQVYSSTNSEFAKSLIQISSKPYEDVVAHFNEKDEKWDFFTLEMLLQKKMIDMNNEKE